MESSVHILGLCGQLMHSRNKYLKAPQLLNRELSLWTPNRTLTCQDNRFAELEDIYMKFEGSTVASMVDLFCGNEMKSSEHILLGICGELIHPRKIYLDAAQLPDRELSLLTTNNILKIFKAIG